MQFRWDSYILYPLIFVAMCVTLICFLIKKYKLRTQRLIIALSFLMSLILGLALFNSYANGVANFELLGISGQKAGFLIAVSIFFYAAIFAAVLHWASDRIQTRKMFIQAGLIASALGAFLLFFGHFVATAILSSILFGYALGSLPLLIMSLNETRRHQLQPIAVSNAIIPTIITGLFGAFMVSFILTTTIQHDLNHLETTWKNHEIFVSLMFCLSIIGLVVSWFIRESTPLITRFTEFELKTFIPYKHGKILMVGLLIIVIIVDSDLSQGSLATWLVGQRAYETSGSFLSVRMFERLFSQIYWVMFFVGSILIGWLLLKRMGIKYTLGIASVVLFIYFVFAAFNHSAIAFLFFQIINGLATGVIVTVLISMSLMWNSRINNVPIGGLTFSGIYFVLFAQNFILNFCELCGVGLYSAKTKPGNIIVNDFGFTKHLDDVTTIIFTVVAITILLIIISIYFLSNYMFAEYVNPNTDLGPKIEKVIAHEFINSENILKTAHLEKYHLFARAKNLKARVKNVGKKNVK